MRLFQGMRRGSVASAGLVIILVAMICASCGSKQASHGLAPGNESGSNASDGGDDATTIQCFGNCGPAALTDGSFVTGAEGGPVTVSPVDADIVTDECPGMLSASMAKAVQSASANSATLKWLYPYDKTVFPGGIAGPVLQWSQTGTPDGVYLHLHSKKFDFKGCYKGVNPPHLQIDAVTWATAIAQSGGKSDPLTVQLSTITGNTASGAISETWTIAHGSLAGNVYYNTYGSKLVPGQTGQNGAVIKIEKGQASAFLYTTGTSVFPFGPCVSCHSLSANGNMLVAQQHMYPGSDPLNGKGSMSFDLTGQAKPDALGAPRERHQRRLGVLRGLSGRLAPAHERRAGGHDADAHLPRPGGQQPGHDRPEARHDVRHEDGQADRVHGSLDPVRPHADVLDRRAPPRLHGGPRARGRRRGERGPHHHDGGLRPRVEEVLEPEDSSSTTTRSSRVGPSSRPTRRRSSSRSGTRTTLRRSCRRSEQSSYAAQLYVVDVATGMSHRLDQTSGYDSTGKEYLPFPGRDENLDFYPTVNPISSGGYFWTYFTSRRAYGNLYPGMNGQGSKDIGTKAIWVSAIDINAAPGTDPSHPAFYLPGQELGSGNIRAFAVLAPCVGDGSSCESGLDCCGGSCTMGKCGVPNTCAGTNDRCTPTVKCCNPDDSCLGGYCGFIAK